MHIKVADSVSSVLYNDRAAESSGDGLESNRQPSI